MTPNHISITTVINPSSFTINWSTATPVGSYKVDFKGYLGNG